MEALIIIEYITQLEAIGVINPDCRTCIEVVYPRLFRGIKLSDIFAPRHKASDRCQSGKHPHCTCDICF